MNVLSNFFLSRAEDRLGTSLDYARLIAQTNFGLFVRYGKIFPFLDPRKHTPPEAYHAARIRAAQAADCGTCVDIEVQLAKNAGIADPTIKHILAGDYSKLPKPVAAAAKLSDAVVKERQDDPDARDLLVKSYQQAGLIELAFAMNGAALLPGIKRALGFASACTIKSNSI